MAFRKRVIRGWGGKNGVAMCVNFNEIRLYISEKPGHEEEWDADEWPPVRVKVTVEAEAGGMLP